MVHTLGRKARRTGDVDGVIKADRTGKSQRHRERRIPTGRGDNTGHWLIDVDPIACAQHGLAVSEGRPGQADARLKVLVVLVIDPVDVRSDTHERSRVRIEDDKSIVTLARRHVPLVTQTELQR